MFSHVSNNVLKRKQITSSLGKYTVRFQKMRKNLPQTHYFSKYDALVVGLNGLFSYIYAAEWNSTKQLLVCLRHKFTLHTEQAMCDLMMLPLRLQCLQVCLSTYMGKWNLLLSSLMLSSGRVTLCPLTATGIAKPAAELEFLRTLPRVGLVHLVKLETSSLNFLRDMGTVFSASESLL